MYNNSPQPLKVVQVVVHGVTLLQVLLVVACQGRKRFFGSLCGSLVVQEWKLGLG